MTAPELAGIVTELMGNFELPCFLRYLRGIIPSNRIDCRLLRKQNLVHESYRERCLAIGHNQANERELDCLPERE